MRTSASLLRLLLLLALLTATTAHAECSVGLGGMLYRHANLRTDQAMEATLGCQVGHFDLRLRYFDRQNVVRERPWGPTEYATPAHVGLSVLRTWSFHRFAGGRLQPQLGAGLLFKTSDAPQCRPVQDARTRCAGDPWTPLPVELAFNASVSGDHWSLNLVHISNAYLHSYNWGQNIAEIGYRW